MSDISDAIRVQMFLADYATVDASNKINALGMAYQWAVIMAGGLTPPSTVVVILELPPNFVGEEFSLELSLHDEAGDVVNAPGLMAEQAVSPIRFAQNITVQRPVIQVEGLRFPRDAVWSRHQMLANFAGGVPLAAGAGYEWRVRIDTVPMPNWALRFYVPAPAAGLVVG